MNPKFRKTYPGKGWVYGTDDQPPNPKKKDIIWISQVHRWDSEVRSHNTRFIIMKKKGKFSMYAIDDKEGHILFHFGDKKDYESAREFASIRKWRQSTSMKEEVILNEVSAKTVKGAGSAALDLYFVYKFAKFIAMEWTDWPAYKLGIIDDEGKIIDKQRNTAEKKFAYTLFHRLLRNLKRLIEKVPGMKSKLSKAVAAYFLFKEHCVQSGADGDMLDEEFRKYINENMPLYESMQIDVLMKQHILLEKVKYE